MSHALIVEDDSDSAELMAALVAVENFTVAIARTLRDARRQIALQQPDIVLLNLQLPDGNGMELITDQPLLAQSEVVLITDHASFDTSIQKHCKYQKERTATVLGISLKTLYNRLKEYGAANKPEEIPPTTIRRRTIDRRHSNRNSLPN